MKRIIAILLLSMFLFGCSSAQKEASEPEIWTWIFHDGTTLEFPNSWNFLGNDWTGNGLYLRDDSGYLYLQNDGATYELPEQPFLEEENPPTELNIDAHFRLFRSEHSYDPDSEYADFFGTTEFYAYMAFMPDSSLFTTLIPITPDISERETALIKVLRTGRSLHDEYNSIGLMGGWAVMVYPDDWEIVNWTLSGWPELSNGHIKAFVALANDEFWFAQIEENELETMIESDKILTILQTPSGFINPEHLTVSDIEYIERYDHALAVYREDNREYIVVHLENGFWLKFSFVNLDGELIYPDDEASVMPLIDSILLNTRTDFHAPFELVLP